MKNFWKENKIFMEIIVAGLIIGKIKEYRGKPEIILENQKQIEVGK